MLITFRIKYDGDGWYRIERKWLGFWWYEKICPSFQRAQQYLDEKERCTGVVETRTIGTPLISRK